MYLIVLNSTWIRLHIGYCNALKIKLLKNKPMRPFKRLFPLSTWLMRFAVVFFVLTTYWKIFTFFNFQSVMFYVATVYVVFSFLLFIGGFLHRASLTVFSSLILILVTGYHAFLNLESKLDHNFAVYIILGSIFIYFFTTDNKK